MVRPLLKRVLAADPKPEAIEPPLVTAEMEPAQLVAEHNDRRRAGSSVRSTLNPYNVSANLLSVIRTKPSPSSVNGSQNRRNPKMATPPALTNNPPTQASSDTVAANTNDITGVVATLASRQSGRPQSAPLSGPRRAAIMMLALGEKYGAKVWSLLHDDEVRELSGGSWPT